MLRENGISFAPKGLRQHHAVIEAGMEGAQRVRSLHSHGSSGRTYALGEVYELPQGEYTLGYVFDGQLYVKDNELVTHGNNPHAINPDGIDHFPVDYVHQKTDYRAVKYHEVEEALNAHPDLSIYRVLYPNDIVINQKTGEAGLRSIRISSHFTYDTERDDVPDGQMIRTTANSLANYVLIDISESEKEGKTQIKADLRSSAPLIPALEVAENSLNLDIPQTLKTVNIGLKIALAFYEAGGNLEYRGPIGDFRGRIREFLGGTEPRGGFTQDTTFPFNHSIKIFREHLARGEYTLI